MQLMSFGMNRGLPVAVASWYWDIWRISSGVNAGKQWHKLTMRSIQVYALNQPIRISFRCGKVYNWWKNGFKPVVRWLQICRLGSSWHDNGPNFVTVKMSYRRKIVRCWLSCATLDYTRRDNMERSFRLYGKRRRSTSFGWYTWK